MKPEPKMSPRKASFGVVWLTVVALWTPILLGFRDKVDGGIMMVLAACGMTVAWFLAVLSDDETSSS